MTTEQTASGQSNTAPLSSDAPAAATLIADPGAQQQQGTEAPAAGEKPADGTTADGTKPEGEKPEGEKPEAAKPPEEGAPEKYEDFAAPEGVKLDAEAVEEFKGLAKELGLKQADAQKVADLGPKLMQKWQAQQAEALSTTVAQWADDTRTDKEIGGDKLDENLAVSRKALDTFGTPELKTLLNESGLGNHPEIIRAFYRAGKAISEDTHVRGNGTSPANNDAKSFYPNSNMN